MQRADDVAVDVSVRVFDRVANARLCREMYDLVELFLGKKRFDRRPVGKVDALHRKLIKLREYRGPCLLE